ncbi:MAG: response regulator [bacterium]
MDNNHKIPILVADDDTDILLFFRAIIKDARYKLYLVSSGFDALEKAQKHKIFLAFIDVNMPDMDGLETLAKWKRIQPTTQIVIISSYSDQELVRRAIKEGAYTYLFKPLNKMDIFSVTVKCLKMIGINNVISF